VVHFDIAVRCLDVNPHDPPSPDRAEVWLLLDRYLAGECTRDEVEHVRKLLAHPEVGRQLAELEQIRRVAADRSPSWNVDRLWQRVAPDRRRSPPNPERSQSPVLGRWPMRKAPWRLSWTHAGIAAAIVALCTVAIEADRVASRRGLAQPAPEAGTTVRAATAQRVVTRLPDGSRITLGPQSVLRYANGYNSATRDVFLDGEAVFEVVHMPNRSFRVHVGNVAVQVLGTTFGVRRYQSDSAVRIVVTSGRVSVGDARLERGDVGIATPAGRVSIAHTGNPDGLLAWTRDTLVFERASAEDVLSTLGRWYGFDVTLASSRAAAEQYTGTFITAGRPLEDALRFASMLMDVRVVREGTHITFR